MAIYQGSVLATYEVTFTVETRTPIDVYANETARGSTVSFYGVQEFSQYCIPATATVKKVQPPVTDGYWHNPHTGAVYCLKGNDTLFLRSCIERDRDNWERVKLVAIHE